MRTRVPTKRRDLAAFSFFARAAAAAGALAVVAASAAAHTADTPPAIARLCSLVRPEYSGDRALTTVAFVEQRWRWPGNRGFDESIDHVAEQLRAAGYVAEQDAKPGDRLTFRIESRPMNGPAWDPLDASLTIVGSSTPLLRWATNRNMLAVNSSSTPDGGVEAEVVSVGKGEAGAFDRVSLAGKIVFGEMSVGRLSS